MNLESNIWELILIFFFFFLNCHQNTFKLKLLSITCSQSYLPNCIFYRAVIFSKTVFHRVHETLIIRPVYLQSVSGDTNKCWLDVKVPLGKFIHKDDVALHGHHVRPSCTGPPCGRSASWLDLNYLYSQMCLLLHLVSVQSFRESNNNYRMKYIITA